MILIPIAVGLVFLIAGAEVLIGGASRLAQTFKISQLVIGLTVVAFGTSAPELAVSVRAAAGGNPEIALGNVLGSNIFNVLLILGLSALIRPLGVSRKVVRLDVPIMIAVSLLFVFLAWNGSIAAWEGILLLVSGLAYILFQVREGRRDETPEDAQATPPAGGLGWAVARVGIGIVMLTMGSRWLVDGASQLARSLGVSDLVIGLTVIAAGTSMPEVATSVMASLRGSRDIAVGNVVGSNVFNILWVLGLGAVVGGGIPISEAAWRFDVPVMVVAALACLPIFFTGYVIARWEGALFFGYYVAYTAFIVLAATQSPGLRAFRVAMSGFVIPLTVVTLAVITWKSLRSRS
jgi:cation:H+ antiporter